MVRTAFVHREPILQKIAHLSVYRCQEDVQTFPHFSFHNDIKVFFQILRFLHIVHN